MSGIRPSSTILKRRLLMAPAYRCFRTYPAPASSSGKNPERVAAGLKATLHNPATSPEAKQHARERLHEMGEKDPERVAAGLKASLHNPATSPEAKKHARQRLHELGHDVDEEHEKPKGTHHHDSGESHSKASDMSQEEHDEHHRMGGYKATLKNAHASPEAKEHAMKVLKEHGAL